MNFLRDLFGLQRVIVDGVELPSCKTIVFEGMGGVGVTGEYDPDSQEITIRITTSPETPPTVSGSRDGNPALQSLLEALASLGLIVDETSE